MGAGAGARVAPPWRCGQHVPSLSQQRAQTNACTTFNPHSRLPPSQIPQVFVNSEFVGGCDILEEMHLSGELRKLLSS